MSLPVQQQVIYLVERLPSAPPQPEGLIDKIRTVVGYLLTTLGLMILGGSVYALASHMTGTLLLSAKTLQSFFMMGIGCTIGGFHLIKAASSNPSMEITAGPLSVSF